MDYKTFYNTNGYVVIPNILTIERYNFIKII